MRPGERRPKETPSMFEGLFFDAEAMTVGLWPA